MTKRSSEMKNLPPLPISKQMAATGFIVISGLLIFLLIGSLAPKTSSLLNAGREFSNQLDSTPDVANQVPIGVNLVNPTQGFTIGNPKGPLTLDLTKGYILSDEANRIPKGLKIPEDLRKQVSIYFDLYTKYSRDNWLIIREGHNPIIIEEWSLDKLQSLIAPPISQTKINLFLKGRLQVFSQRFDSLHIQRGMKEDFAFRVHRHKRWFSTIEKMFTNNNLPKEYSRIFLVPSNKSLSESSDPWTTLEERISKKYLVKSNSINENRSPLKVARVLATVMNKQKYPSQKWLHFFNSPINIDARYFAALYADVYRDKLDFLENAPSQDSKIKAFKLYRQTSIAQLLKELKIELPVFLENNPDLIKNEDKTILPKTFVFFVRKPK